MSVISGTDTLGVGIAPILVGLLLALPITITGTLVLIRTFRKQVARSMQGTVGAVRPEADKRPVQSRAFGDLQIKRIDVTNERIRAAHASPIVAAARQRAWRLAAIFGLAACAHPVVLAAIMSIKFLDSHKPRTQHQIGAYVLLYAVYFLQTATPVTLAVAMILTRQLRFLIVSVLALIAALWGLGWTLRGADLVGLWVLIAGLPTGVVLLLNARRVRAVGSIVFGATLIFVCVIIIGHTYGALLFADFIGPVHFIREDLAQLPFPTAVMRYLDEATNVPEAIEMLFSDTWRLIRADHAERMTLGYKFLLVSLPIITVLIGVSMGWLFIRWLAVRYLTRRASDQMLTIDVLMAIFTFTSFLFFYFAFGLVASICTLAGFGGYKLYTYRLFRPSIGISPAVGSFKLLLLRVFRSDRRGHLLVEKIMKSWRYFGPVRLIAGTDLVDSTIEPHEFFEFLSGRLSRSFVKNREDLEHRLLKHKPGPDPDGLYRIEDFFCHLDTWQMTVAYLARHVDVVLMDLRGFSSARRGCTFEIGMLLHSVSVNRVVLMADNATDYAYLEETLRLAWSTLPDTSPNARAGQHQICLLQVSSQHHALDCTLGLLWEKAQQSV
ncbi:MAG: hypothetical protein JO076_15830 [Verrucomicrobia bacterium]|nr:hypothetical protein [Verrucomicrobiota bacterium]